MNVNESFPLRHWRPSPWNVEFVSYQHKITENWHILSLTIKKVKTKTHFSILLPILFHIQSQNTHAQNVKIENDLRTAQIAFWPGGWMGGEALGAPVDWWWVYSLLRHLLTLSGLCLAPGNPWFWPGSGGAVWMPLNLFGSTNATDFRVRWTGGVIPVTAAGVVWLISWLLL